MSKDDIEYESFPVISIDSLLFYKIKYHLQVYLYNFIYKIVKTLMTGYLDGKLFESYKNKFLIFINGSYVVLR